MNLRSLAPRVPAFVRQHGFSLALVLLLAYLVLRSAGLGPSLFADELYYSRGARLLAPGASTVPDHLYYALYRLSNSCGSGFLDCARMLNALFYVAAAPFLFLIARQVCSRGVASVVVLLCLLAPFSLYTTYFIPEPLYFTLFSAFAALALCWRTAAPLPYGLATGAVLGLLSLVKPHALFLLPALLAFIAYRAWQGATGRARWRDGALMLLGAPLATLGVKLGLGYLLAGAPGLSLFGQLYSSMAGDTSVAGMLALLATALHSFGAHLFALALLFAVPAAALLLHASSRQLRARQGAELRALQVFAVLMLGAGLALTVMFTARLGMGDPAELLRVHQRYYDFMFPLLVIIGAAALTGPGGAAPVAPLKRVLVAAAVALLALLAARFYATGGALPGATDSPELWSMLVDANAAKLLLGGTLVLLAVWSWRRPLAARLFVFVLLPATVWQGTLGLHATLAAARKPNAFDRAARSAKLYLDKADLAQLTVVGAYGDAGIERALFVLDDLKTGSKFLAPGAALNGAELVPGQWLLVVGAHALPAGVRPQLQTADYALVRVGGDVLPLASIAFSGELPGAFLASASGLAWPEPPFGRWSEAAQVRLETRAPLPKALSLVLKGNAFGPVATQELVISVGAQRQVFHLSDQTELRHFSFDTDGSEHVITIDVPQPMRPSALGMGSDDRLLGLRMTTLEVGRRR